MSEQGPTDIMFQKDVPEVKSGIHKGLPKDFDPHKILDRADLPEACNFKPAGDSVLVSRRKLSSLEI